jgi:hypothetical protein
VADREGGTSREEATRTKKEPTAEAGCNWYLRGINKYSLLKKMYIFFSSSSFTNAILVRLGKADFFCLNLLSSF